MNPRFALSLVINIALGTAQTIAGSTNNIILPWLRERDVTKTQALKHRKPWRQIQTPFLEDQSLLLCYSPLTISLATAVLGAAGKFLTAEPSRRAFYFWKHAMPIIAHYKFTQWWLSTTKANQAKRDLVYDTLHDQYAQPSLGIILHLKGLYVKIGQILSTRPDFMPHQYIDLFSSVQDNIPQWPIAEIRQIIEDALATELGLKWLDVFESMDEVALGSASIGQVHRATIRDEWIKYNNGSNDVAVKVMHPGAKDRFAHDFQVFRWLCRVALPGWSGFINELEKRIMTEFDYRNEEKALWQVGENMAKSPYRNLVRVPKPVTPLCSKHVLVMDMMKGKKFIDAIKDQLADALGGDGEKATRVLMKRQKEIFRNENDGAADILHESSGLVSKLKLLYLRNRCRHYVDLLVDVHGHQIFENGLFNGDPHHGNVLLLEDGRLGLLDYGQTRNLTAEERISLSHVLLTMESPSISQVDVAAAMRQAGFRTRNHDDEIMVKYATLFFDSDLDSKRSGFATPQLYFASLMMKNPLVEFPDSAVFIARVSFLFRGLGSGMGTTPIRTAKYWSKHASNVLAALK